ncbi:DUF378 domain-containing protein [Mycetohabitans sp. B5]|nr:DUF378 domain-containing protein [Mycetohabitans sp. B5]
MARAVYALVGLSEIYCLVRAFTASKVNEFGRMDMRRPD